MENMVETTKEDLVAPQDHDISKAQPELYIGDLIGWPWHLPNQSPLKQHKLLSIHTVIYPENRVKCHPSFCLHHFVLFYF